MNQILNTSLNGKNNNDTLNKENKLPKKREWLKFQFSTSVCIIIFTIIFSAYYFYKSIKKEEISNDLISNYDIYTLYSADKIQANIDNLNSIFGIIEIPSIDVYYPIFSNLNEELLKISPCKFYGDSPSKTGNICIAGHNYDNSLFFSKIALLKANDKIYIYDNLNIKYTYIVKELYEVKSDDLSPIFNYPENKKNLTLITCNNINYNRIILRAEQI